MTDNKWIQSLIVERADGFEVPEPKGEERKVLAKTIVENVGVAQAIQLTRNWTPPPITALPEDYKHHCYCTDIPGVLGVLIQYGKLSHRAEGIPLFYALVGSVNDFISEERPSPSEEVGEPVQPRMDQKCWPMENDVTLLHWAAQQISFHPKAAEAFVQCRKDTPRDVLEEYILKWRVYSHGAIVIKGVSKEERDSPAFRHKAFEVFALLNPKGNVSRAFLRAYFEAFLDDPLPVQEVLLISALLNSYGQLEDGWMSYHIHRGLHSHVAEQVYSGLLAAKELCPSLEWRCLVEKAISVKVS